MTEVSHDTRLLDQLYAMRIEPEGASLSFTDRLASENGWSESFAECVFREYARFLYLAVVAGHPVTPSDEVDQAWHLHLAYSRHYWGVMCRTIIGKDLHHGPTAGGGAEESRYSLQYRETIAAYREYFGKNPPSKIWPNEKRRFGAQYVRMETGRHWHIPKSAVCATLVAPLLASCTSATEAVVSVGGMIVLAVVIGIVEARHGYGRKKDNKGSGGGCGTGGSSGCGSGCGGCGS
jgi:hypothetical protein